MENNDNIERNNGFDIFEYHNNFYKESIKNNLNNEDLNELTELYLNNYFDKIIQQLNDILNEIIKENDDIPNLITNKDKLNNSILKLRNYIQIFGLNNENFKKLNYIVFEITKLSKDILKSKNKNNGNFNSFDKNILNKKIQMLNYLISKIKLF